MYPIRWPAPSRPSGWSPGPSLPQPITEAFRNPYLCEIIRGIGEVCEPRELSLTMLPPLKGRVIEAARRASVDGLITIGVGPDHEVVELIHNRHIPFVTIDGQTSEATVNIGVDDEERGLRAHAPILELGHRRIAVLALRPETINPPESRFSLVRDRRLAGFARALDRSASPSNRPAVSVVPVESSVEGGAAAAASILASPGPAPTAIVAMADVVALGAYDACRKSDRAIPADLSVSGFDDIPMAAMVSPPLTTVRQPGREKGQVGRFAGPRSPRR